MSHDIAMDRGLPVAIDHERTILGALLKGCAEYQLVAGILETRDYALEKHRRIMDCIGTLYAAGNPISINSVALALRDRGQIESCDGVSYLAELTDGVPALTGASLDYYCGAVKKRSMLRQVIFYAKSLMDQAFQGVELPSSLIAKAHEAFREIEGQAAPKPTLRNFGQILDAHGGLNAYGKSGETGIQTPWPSLNRITGGFLPGQMITIAGLTGTGKSAAALQIAQHAAEHGTGVALFSLEMSAKEIFDRAACSRAGIDSKKLERGTLSQVERRDFQRAVAELVELPLWIDDSTACTLPAMHLALRKHVQRHPVGLLIIDYLQLMQTTGGKENRTQEVTEISRGMKLAAREFNVPVIVLAQFNRGPATTKREPELHDLRDSGSIEQDSDKVVFLHRKGELETSMIVAKQRNGKSRKYVDLLFVERNTRFEERAKATAINQGDAA